MPTPLIPYRRFAFGAVVILLSSMIWLISWEVSQRLFGFTALKQGITLVYIPAGVRLVVLMISGLWGAIGVCLAFPFALLQVFPNASWQEVVTYSAIAGFVPYAAILGTCRGARISRDLSTLRSIHLPMLSAAVSVTGSLSYAAALVAFGRFSSAAFLPDATAMTAGDFLGCFAVVLIMRLVIAGGRKVR